MLKEVRTVTTWPYNMFYFPLVMKTHFCMCLSLSTNNMISLQCKWSLTSVILNTFAQSICISLKANNMIPSDTLNFPILVQHSDTNICHIMTACCCRSFVFTLYWFVCKDTWWTFSILPHKSFFSYTFIQINSYLIGMRLKTNRWERTNMPKT